MGKFGAAENSGNMLKSVYDADGDNVVDSASAVAWSGVSGRPSAFIPASHTHAKSEITDYAAPVTLQGSTPGTADAGNLNISGVSIAAKMATGGATSFGTAAVLQSGTPTTAINDAKFAIATDGATNKGIVIQAESGQSVNPFQIQDSAGAELFGVTSDGKAQIAKFANGTFSTNQLNADTGTVFYFTTTSNKTLTAVNIVTGQIVLLVINRTGSATITFGSGFTSVASMTATTGTTYHFLTSFNGTTLREIARL